MVIGTLAAPVEATSQDMAVQLRYCSTPGEYRCSYDTPQGIVSAFILS